MGAAGGFVTGVTGAVFGLFKLLFAPAALFVTLIPPPELGSAKLELVSGRYAYDEPMADGQVKTHSGGVEVTLDYGGWRARLPPEVLTRPVKLQFLDSDENSWQVRPFYPNHTRQEMIRASTRTDAEPKGPLSLMGPAVALAASERLSNEGGIWRVQDRTSEQAVRFTNYAREHGTFNNRKYYQWRIFVNEPQSILDRIQEVQYVLHPTFPEPYQTSRDVSKQFELVSAGWGEFTVLITVVYKSGREGKTSYFLDLSKSWPESN